MLTRARVNSAHALMGLAALAIFASVSSEAADTDKLAIEGFVKQPLHLSVDDLKKQPATEIDAHFTTGHGEETSHYKGVLLWTLIGQAGLPDEAGKAEHHLARYVDVTGSDGYTVAVSVGELDTEFEGKSVLIAYERDGKPIQGTGLRLVVPGDYRPGRAVRDVVKIEVK